MARKKITFDREPTVEEFQRLTKLRSGDLVRWRNKDDHGEPPYGSYKDTVKIIKVGRDISCGSGWGAWVDGRDEDSVCLTWIKEGKEYNIIKILKKIDAL